MILDPAKLLLIAVVALMVLGPEKIPGAARKVSSLLKDLQNMRASVQGEIHHALDDLPLGAELKSARKSIGQVTKLADPRQALYRAASISTSSEGSGALPEATHVPGSVDLPLSEEHPGGIQGESRVGLAAHFDPSQN
jgi:sec-independent protein translocase protein TatB